MLVSLKSGILRIAVAGQCGRQAGTTRWVIYRASSSHRASSPPPSSSSSSRLSIACLSLSLSLSLPACLSISLSGPWVISYLKMFWVARVSLCPCVLTLRWGSVKIAKLWRSNVIFTNSCWLLALPSLPPFQRPTRLIFLSLAKWALSFVTHEQMARSAIGIFEYVMYWGTS